MADTTTASTKDDRAAVFTQKASLVSACVHGVKDRSAALDKALALLAEKPPLDLQMPSGKKTDPSDRILAAPNLDQDRFRQLSEKCGRYPHIQLIRDRLRDYPGGIDMGLTQPITASPTPAPWWSIPTMKKPVWPPCCVRCMWPS